MAENAEPAATTTTTQEIKQPCQDSKRNGYPIKNVEGLVSVVTFVFSLPVLGSVIWLFIMREYNCEALLRLRNLQIQIAVGMVFFFLISNIAVALRSRSPMIGFFLVMLLAMTIFTVGLALVGGYKLESRKIIATPTWFEGKVRNDNDWQNIKSCIYASKTCDDLTASTINLRSSDYSLKKLSPIEHGCCNPPAVCGMKYANATFWVKDDEAMVGEDTYDHPHDADCDKWQNGRTVLCYDCESCKQGYVTTMESKWWQLGAFLVVMALLLAICHLLLFIVAMMRRYNG